MKTLDLSDGRVLAYEDGGSADGAAVFFQHGTGDSRLARHPDNSIAGSLGVRLITTDRPGVGGSSARKGRHLLDWPADIEALADALGVEEFAVAGHSGGGPHALAIAHVLGDRVRKIGLASALAPFDQPGVKKLVENKELQLVWKFAHTKFLANAVSRVESKHYLRDLEGFVAHLADEAPADKAVLEDPVLEPMFEAEMGEALKQGGIGVLDDMWAFLDWKFTPEEVNQHVDLFFGDADEILDPKMADLLAGRLPDCESHTWPGGGHYSVFAHWEEFLAPLA